MGGFEGVGGDGEVDGSRHGWEGEGVNVGVRCE